MTVIGRSIQGVVGALFPLILGILHSNAPPTRLSGLIGLIVAAMSLSAAAGYIIAGYFVDAGQWRLIFWFTAICGCLLLPGVAFIRESWGNAGEKRQLDILGGILLALALIGLLLGLNGGGISSALDRADLFMAGAILLLLTIWWEARHRNPLIDVRLFKNPSFALGIACSAILGFGMMNTAILTMMLLQQPNVAGFG